MSHSTHLCAVDGCKMLIERGVFYCSDHDPADLQHICKGPDCDEHVGSGIEPASWSNDFCSLDCFQARSAIEEAEPRASVEAAKRAVAAAVEAEVAGVTHLWSPVHDTDICTRCGVLGGDSSDRRWKQPCTGVKLDRIAAGTEEKLQRMRDIKAHTRELEALDPRARVDDQATADAIKSAARDAREAEKDGKTPFELLDLPFLGAQARQLAAGLAGKPDRSPDSWKRLDPGVHLPKYRAALMRHFAAAQLVGSTDPASGESHYAAVAVNATICAYFERQLVAPALSTAEVVAAIAERFDLSTVDAVEFALSLARKLEAQQVARDEPTIKQQLDRAVFGSDADRRFGQPHYGHGYARAPMPDSVAVSPEIEPAKTSGGPFIGERTVAEIVRGPDAGSDGDTTPERLESAPKPGGESHF